MKEVKKDKVKYNFTSEQITLQNVFLYISIQII